MINRRLLIPLATAATIGVVLAAGVGVTMYQAAHRTTSVASSLKVSLPDTTGPILPISNQVIGGNLSITDGISAQTLTLHPMTSVPKAGQLYLSTDGSLNYFNGSQNLNMSATAAAVSQPGTGLVTKDGRLSNSGVVSLQGQSGDVLLTGGSGIAVNGTTITNSGVTSIGGQSGGIALGTGLAVNNGKLESTASTLPQDLAPTSSPTFDTLALSSALSVSNGGTGAASLLQNGILVGRGTQGVASVAADTAGQCLISTAGAPAFQACPGGSGGVSSVNGLSGVLTIAAVDPSSLLTSNGSITIQDASATIKGLASFNTANMTVTAGVVNTIQNIATTSTPTFAGLSLGTALAVTQGGTGATTSTGARANLGAAASGTNGDIASLTGLTSIAPTAALSIGSVGQNLALQGANTTLSAHATGFSSNLTFVAPTANVTYQLQAAAAGTYDVCTTAGNCVGIGGGVTSPGGTIGRLSKFISGSAIGDSIITDNGSSVSIAGALNVNTITPTAAAVIGTTTQSLALQGSSTTVSSTNTGVTNTLSFATPSGVSKSITIPNASGTVAVSATGPIALDSSGNLTCPSCLTNGTSGGTTGVSSLNGATGTVTLTAIDPASVSTVGTTITVQDASTAVKGLASFNATNFTVTNGLVTTVQGISTAASPLFNGLSLTNALSIANGGTGLNSTPANGQLMIGTGSGYALAALTAGSGITIGNAAGGITISAPSSGSCPSCANQALTNLGSVALNTNLTPGVTNTIDLGSAALAFRNGYLAGTLQTGAVTSTGNITTGATIQGGGSVLTPSLDAVAAGALNIGTATATSLAVGSANITGTLAIESGASSTINLGNTASARTVNVATGAAAQKLTIGSLASTSTTTLQAGSGTPSGDFNIQAAAGGIINIANNNVINKLINIGSAGNTPAASSVNIATTIANATQSVNIGSTASANNTVLIQGGISAAAVSLQAAATGTIAIGTVNNNTIALGNSSAASNVSLNQNTVVAANKSLTANGGALFQDATNSTTAFGIQNAAGTSILNVDTTTNTINVGAAVSYNTYTPGSGFATHVEYSTGTSPVATATGDFNGDGYPDVVTANSSANTVSVLISNGDGTFGAKTDYATGLYPKSIAVGDFNGDGKLDLAVVDWNSSVVSILLGNGDGTFGAKTDYAVGINPTGIAVGDFNGDGKLDLAVADNGANTISVLLGTGTGTFGAKTDYATAASSNPTGIAVGDFNGDGKLDLAVTENGINKLAFFPGNGNGTFGAHVDSATGTGPTGIAVGDFNGDGKADVAVIDLGANAVSILLGASSPYGFGAKTDYTTGTTPNSVAVGDFNGDGKADVAVANQGSATVSILPGTGAGAFGTKTDYATATSPAGLSQADFNHDGHLDLVMAASSNRISVLMSGTLFTVNAGLSVATPSASQASLILRGTTGQVADLLHIQNSTGAALFSVSNNGAVMSAGNINSSASIQGGISVLTPLLDTSTATALNIGTTNATAINLNQNTTIAANKSLTANGSALFKDATNSTTAFQVQNTAASALLTADTTTMTVTVAQLVVNTNITVNGHIVTGGTAPTIAAGAAACTTPTVSVSGNDTAGTITVTSGSACTAPGVVATLTFNTAYGTAPRVTLTPRTAASAGLGSFNGAVGTTNFTLDSSVALTNATTYMFNYFVAQ